MVNHPAVVSVQWLKENRDNSSIAIADCRFSLAQPQLGRMEYEQGHIPGAFYLDLNQDLSSPVEKHGGRHPLPHPDTFAAKLSTLGVNSPQTLVIAYDDSRLAFAARLWWLLRYFGHQRVAVLDGGFSAWQKAGYPIETEIPQFTPGKFIPHIQPQMVVDYTYVLEHKDLAGVKLIDARERDRYLGKHEPIDPVAGHIPGAINYPWQTVTDESGFLRSVAEQQARWESIRDEEEAIAYCGSGVTACVNLLSLELAGFRNTKLYAGSWSDWISY